jgi:hypothetical protein
MYLYNKEQTIKVKREINKWISSFNPSHFLSIQFPINLRSNNFNNSQKYLKDIMIKFEAILLGPKWNLTHLPFIAIAEHNKIEGWHYHIYIYDNTFLTDKLKKALKRLCKYKNLPPETFHLDIIDKNVGYTCSYGTKQTVADTKGHFNPDCIILSYYLFDLPITVQSR